MSGPAQQSPDSPTLAQRLGGYGAGLMAMVPEPIRRLGGRLLSPLVARWRSLDQRQRIHAYALALLMVGSLANFLVYTVYYIEDAGISVAYARNFAAGEGWVTYAGGERVEGFSNPLWTWLITLGYWVGIPGWTSVKVLGAIFGCVTLPIAYHLSRACRGHGERPPDHLDLLAPLFLAASTTVAIWNASGLENSLFNLLLAGGMLRTLREGERDEPWVFPWSAVLFLGLACTRPEGIVYAAGGGFFRLVLALRKPKPWRPVLLWLVVFFLPFGLYQAWRYNYFAWPFANTYYAKLDGENRFVPWRWSGRGWTYFRNYARAYGLAFVSPLFLIGMLRLKDWRKWLVVGLTAFGVMAILWNGRDGLPPEFDPDWLAYLQKHWDQVRIGFLLTALGVSGCFTTTQGSLNRLGVCLIGLGAVLMGLFGLGEVSVNVRYGLIAGGGGVIVLACLSNARHDAVARLMVMGMGAAACFFIIYSGGDWMAQWRFWSYASVPMFVLLGLGTARLVESLPGYHRKLGPIWIGGLWATPVVLAVGLPNIWQAMHAAPTPETTVSQVHNRVKYMTWVQNRLHVDRVILFDVDMGAHMYFSGWRIKDVAGLVDVPMARHSFQKDFITEYVFTEEPATFAHMHGGWARKVKVASLPIWKANYIEVPGYPTGKSALHVGNHVRRDLILKSEYTGPPDRSVDLEGRVTLVGWDIASPEVPVAGLLYVEYWLQAPFRDEGVRAYVILDDGQGNRAMSALPPAYDWVPVDKWATDETAHMRYDFELPATLPEGSYDVGFWFLDVEEGGTLSPRAGLPDGAREGAIAGSVMWTGGVEIVSRSAAEAAADADLGRAHTLAEEGSCEDAWRAWREAARHVYKNTKWRNDRVQAMNTAVSLCYVRRASATESVDEQVRWIEEARWHDHTPRELTRFARPLAAELDATGDALRAEGDIEGAYQAYRQALKCDPRLSWTRRKAEEVRDERLEIEGKVKDGAQKPPPREVLKKDDDAPLEIPSGPLPHQLQPRPITPGGDVTLDIDVPEIPPVQIPEGALPEAIEVPSPPAEND